MPLSETGKQVLANMIKEYGPEKGRDVFYASENKGIKGSQKWTLKDEIKKRSAKRSTKKQAV